ncbi:MAG: shikimate kinase [Cyclobacteriaceae bacterium]|nr:shikimate kinase [Cyclobacteriaceae bacterium HetDA_MAG_MS6]
MSTRLFLVGMPGAGKTTFGQKLAKAADLPFFDLDDEIVSATGRGITDIFSHDGEKAFRKIESEALQSAINRESNAVISSGGGAPCFNQNMTLMNDSGITIFLDTPLQVIISRISKETHRPLLQGDELSTRLNEMYEKRKAFYELASVKVREADPDPTQLLRHPLLLKVSS